MHSCRLYACLHGAFVCVLAAALNLYSYRTYKSCSTSNACIRFNLLVLFLATTWEASHGKGRSRKKKPQGRPVDPSLLGKAMLGRAYFMCVLRLCFIQLHFCLLILHSYYFCRHVIIAVGTHNACTSGQLSLHKQICLPIFCYCTCTRSCT